jgi:hypothetical protein
MRQKLMKSVLFTMVCVSSTLLETSCMTVEGVKAAKGTGITVLCNQPYDYVWDNVLAELNTVHTITLNFGNDLGPYFKLNTVDKAKGLIVAKGSPPARPTEVYMAIYVTQLADNNSQVEFIEKSGLIGVPSAHWDKKFSDQLKYKCLSPRKNQTLNTTTQNNPMGLSGLPKTF